MNLERPTAEQSELFGKEVKLQVHYMRHAEKMAAEGELTERGREEAREFGAHFVSSSEGTKVYHSPIPRAQQTAEEINSELEGGRYKTRLKTELLGLLPSESVPFSKQFFAQYAQIAQANGGNEDAALEWYLSFGANRPDPDTLSPYELAGRVAKTVLDYCILSGKLKNNSQVDLINISHSGVLETFIQEVFAEEFKDSPGNGLVEKMGGGLHYLEGFTIDIERKNKEQVEIRISFRDRTRRLTLEELQSIGTTQDISE